MNPTKMEGEKERHLPKTDDWHMSGPQVNVVRRRDETKK